MNQHVYAYLSMLAWDVMPDRDVPRTRAAQRAHVLDAVRQFPEQHRGFIASKAWARLGYGGGL